MIATLGSQNVRTKRGKVALWKVATALTIALLLFLPAGAASGAGFGVEGQLRGDDPGVGVRSTDGSPSLRTQRRQPDPPADWPDDTVPGSLLVTTTDHVRPDDISATLRDAGLAGAATQVLGSRVIHVEVPAGTESRAAATLDATDGVVAVDPDRLRKPARKPDDPELDRQWAHDQADAFNAWDVTTGSPTVRVAILDDGIRGDHPDLADNIREAQVSTATGEVRRVGTDVDNDPCKTGHGTLVGGVVAGVGNNGRGVAGVSWQASLVDVSMASPEVGCKGFADSAILAGMDYAITNPRGPVDVINLSVGGVADSCPRSFQSLIDDARAAGAVVVAASGNYGTDETVIPAACNGVISVGATGFGPAVAPYSNSNRQVDLVAPGGNGEQGSDALVVTTSRDIPLQATEAVEGTSFAAPYAAGVATLVYAVADDLRTTDGAGSADAVESILERTTVDLAEPGRDASSGWGLIQAGAAVRTAAAGDYEPTPEPDPPFPVNGQDGSIDAPNESVEVFRIAADRSPTEAIPQAIAVSRAVFDDGGATHAILARNDNYADALAGSALSAGSAPLLFTRSTGSLAMATGTELRRVLPDGSIVYMLGGPNALPRRVADEIRDMGYQPIRLAGPSREETAVKIAEEVVRLQVPRIPAVLLATRANWPDAVAGGSIAATYGTPVLLTSPTRLHPATARALRDLRPETLYTLGGSGAVTDQVEARAGRVAGVAPPDRKRLAGAARDGTMVAISRELEELLADVDGVDPAYATAVNVRRADGYAHVLSASIIPGRFGAVFVPVEGTAGDRLTSVARDYVRALRVDGVVVGGGDLIADATASELQELLSASRRDS